MGIFAWIVFGVFIMLYRLNLNDVCSTATFPKTKQTYGTGETPVDFPGGNRTAP